MDKMLTDFSREGIQKKVDDFLETKKPYSKIELLLPVQGASKFDYRGLSIREWYYDGNVRYDTAVKIHEEK